MMRFLIALGCAFLLCLPVALFLLVLASRLYYGGHGLIGGFENWHVWLAFTLFAVSFVGGFRWGWDLKKPKKP